MIDLALGILLVLVLYRGSRRGFIREVADILLLVSGALLAFRLGGPTSSFLESWTGVSPLVGRMVGVFGVFIAIRLVGSFVLRRFLPRMGPARSIDRVGGAAVAGGWFVVVATMMLLVASAIPFGPGIERLMDESRAVDLITGQGSVAKNAVSTMVGDRILESLVNLNQILGDRQVVIEGDETVSIPVLDGRLVDARPAAREVFELLNRARVSAGVDPLAWSDGLADVAGHHGFEMYQEGYFSHMSPTTGTVADRMVAAGIPYLIVGENLALSPTPESVHDGLMASPGHRQNMLDDRFTRVGISAVEGPLGVMVVQVFSR